MSKKFLVAAALVFIVAFAIPIEHKYDKLFRFFSLTLIPKGLEISSQYDKKIYFYISDLISMALLFLSLFWFRIAPRRFFGNPIWILFFCAFLSILTSPFASYPIPYTRLLHLLTPLILFSFLTNVEEKSEITRVILVAIVLAGLFQTAISIAQYFHQGPLGLRLIGETNQQAIFTIPDGSRWLFDQLFHRSSQSQVVMRVAGTFSHPNVFGGLLVFSMLATYALIVQIPKWKWLLGLTIPLQFFALSLSYSRSALFAWGIANLVWFGMMMSKRVKFVAVLAAVSFAISAILLLNQYASRGGILGHTPLSKYSDAIRKFHQNVAFDILKDHPLTGLGFNQFSEGAVPYFPKNTDVYVRSTAPHNIFLFLACETGLIAGATLFIWMITLIWKGIRAPVTAETATFTALLVGYLFIGLCDFYLILFQQGILMLFLATALLAIHVQKKVPDVQPVAP